ncbi:MAG: hypothetical protein GY757_59300, partial [bacterium]|nr:hypothetical protein [bacterium]
NAFLAKLCKQDDITVVSGTAGRNHVDLEQLIGIFVKPYIIKTKPSANKPFETYLKEVMENHIQVMEHDLFPFEMLIDEFATDGDNRMIANVHFNMINKSTLDASAYEEFSEESLKTASGEFKLAKDDFSLQLFELSTGLFLDFEYNTDLFTEDKIKLLSRWFTNIVTQVLTQPAAAIGSYYLSTGQETELFAFLNKSTGEFEAIYPLTPTQRDLYLDCIIKPHAKNHRLIFYYLFDPIEVDIPAWKETLNRIHREHPILKSRLLSRGNDIYLAILENLDFELKYRDLSQQAHVDIEETLNMMTRDVTQNPDGELLTYYLLKLPDRQVVHAISVHHIIFDGHSGKMLFEKFHETYESIMENRNVENRNVENRNVENRNVENRNVE